MTEFLCPKLVGERFGQHTIPLELLKDLAVLEEMLVEIAKYCYRQEHPGRQRAPKGFTDEISLHLTGIDEGSAIVRIDLIYRSNDLLPPYARTYFDQARDRLVGAIAAAANEEPISDHLPESLLGYFDRFGRGLQDGEYVDFLPDEPERRAHLSRKTRHRLLWASGRVEEVSEEVALRGSIPEIDQQKGFFSLQVVNGPRVTAPLAEQHAETVHQAFRGYRDGVRVLLQGVARYNRTERLQSIESVEHISLLDPLDVPARLEEFRLLKAGWLDGARGVGPSAEGLDWLAHQFEWYYPDNLRLPWLYPTAEGGVQAEWTLGEHEVTLDIDLSKRSAEWHALALSTEDEQHEALDLSSEGGWQDLAHRLETLGGVAE